MYITINTAAELLETLQAYEGQAVNVYYICPVCNTLQFVTFDNDTEVDGEGDSLQINCDTCNIMQVVSYDDILQVEY